MRNSIFARMVPVFLGLMCLGQSARSQGNFHKDFFNPQMLCKAQGNLLLNPALKSCCHRKPTQPTPIPEKAR